MANSLFEIVSSQLKQDTNYETQVLTCSNAVEFTQKDYKKVRIECKNGMQFYAFSNQVKNLPEYIGSEGVECSVTIKPSEYTNSEGIVVNSFEVVSIKFKPSVKIYTTL